MPLVGYKTKLPTNEDLNKIMNSYMEEDGINMGHYENQAKLDQSSAYGSYRKIIGFASDILYDIVEFQSTNEDLLTPNYNEEADPTPEVDRTGLSGSILRALRLKFSLR